MYKKPEGIGFKAFDSYKTKSPNLYLFKTQLLGA